MTESALIDVADSAQLRKARGAFFTPPPIAEFMADWAVRSNEDAVFEPSAGEAAFLVAAVRKLLKLGASAPTVSGVELHPASAAVGLNNVALAGGVGQIGVGDFFVAEPRAEFDAVIGNPPYIRFQDFNGAARGRARAAAFKLGVPLTGLASSWAAFTLQSTLYLREGGRLALVLPAELLSVNYASPVRRFLFDTFAEISLVVFDEQVFPDAEADVVLLLADGYRNGPASHAKVFSTRNADGLKDLVDGLTWHPGDPAAKWTDLLVDPEASEPLRTLLRDGDFAHLESWGDTTLGMVTGNNAYFTLSPERVRELGLERGELLRVSPAGSSHLRGLELTHAAMRDLGKRGKGTWLFRPRGELSAAARRYVAAGEESEVHQAYKCRVRKTWYEVPLVPPSDLLLTCMNADTPRLTTNTAGARHLNSVHGVYLRGDVRELGREFLPLASLNSVTLLHAEVVGRAYGGGVLKLEPREADVWDVPSAEFVASRAHALRGVRESVSSRLGNHDLLGAVQLVDDVLFAGSSTISTAQLAAVRDAREALYRRRSGRGTRGKS